MDNPFVRRMVRHIALPPAARAALDALARQQVRRVPARQDVVRHHEDPHHTHMILDGWACRYKQLPDGRRAIVSFFLPGDICDPSVVRLPPMDHAIAALTTVTLARLTPEALNEAARAHPAIEECLLRDVLATLAMQREWTVSLARRSAIERLAHLFCELSARLAAVGLADGPSVPMPATQPDLADALGQTSVHINRILRELRGAGLLDLRARRLTIHDPEGLKGLALFDPRYLHLA